MRATAIKAAWIVVGLSLAGCGGGSRATLETCLNGQGFLVQEAGRVVRGSSPGGVSFTLTVYPTRAAAGRVFARESPTGRALIGSTVVDFTGNPPPYPGGAPAKLSQAALATIRSCLTA